MSKEPRKKDLPTILENIKRQTFNHYTGGGTGRIFDVISISNIKDLIGYAKAATSLVKDMRTKAIEAGAAHFNPKTGEFEWLVR